MITAVIKKWKCHSSSIFCGMPCAFTATVYTLPFIQYHAALLQKRIVTVCCLPPKPIIVNVDYFQVTNFEML